MLSVILWILLALAALVALGLLIAWRFSATVAKKAAAAIPPRGHFTEVPGGRIHWVEQGEGPPLVLIHGLAGNLHNFGYVMDRLAADYRVIAVDRPGCGWSERDGDGQARIPEQARMIADMLEKEGIEPAVLVGHSLGGAVSLTMALNHPERVRALALISALVRAPSQPAEAFAGIDIANPSVRRFVANTLAVPMSIRNGDKTLAFVFGPDAPPADFRTRGGGLLGLRPDAFYAAATDLQAVARDMDAITARIGEIALPVGLFYGTDDRILSAADQIAVLRQALPQADIETMEDRGHMPLVIEPDRIDAFVRRIASA
ncbi:MAG: alpha/beta fold hydrolase [Pseudomonadota bacterium]|nr:alpha/beta fold hydrolase [Pseudomonadota bacterium]